MELMTRFHLQEHSSPAYPPRTEQNVIDSDGTVIFGNPDSPGCSLTLRLCKKHNKYWLIMEEVAYEAKELRRWLDAYDIAVLNVAGNRERTNPGIYQRTYDTIVEALR